MSDPSLASDRVRLRPLEQDDLEHVVALHNDLAIKTLTLSWPLPVTRDACASWIASHTNVGDDATWVIASPAGDFWGIVRVFDLDRLSRHAEVGLYLHADARGQGVGQAALALVNAWAFDFFGLHRLEARILATNAPALQLFEQIGFAREGVQREREFRGAEYHDVVLLGMLAPS